MCRNLYCCTSCQYHYLLLFTYHNAMSTVVITNIYSENDQTRKMVESVARCGLPLVNFNKGRGWTGNGDVMRWMYECLVELKDQYTHAIYSDGGDTYFLRAPVVPDDCIMYSTERACYPHPHWQEKYTNKETPWCYLNGGGHCGPIPLLIEWMERYGLKDQRGDINGQAELMQAYFKAHGEFPIVLDQQCSIFQTLAFADSNEFDIVKRPLFTGGSFTGFEKAVFQNNITGTWPAILHGNGRVKMDWVYENL